MSVLLTCSARSVRGHAHVCNATPAEEVPDA